eukprot:12698115-Alexandrium_andersonii.AAC.1
MAERMSCGSASAPNRTDCARIQAIARGATSRGVPIIAQCSLYAACNEAAYVYVHRTDAARSNAPW